MKEVVDYNHLILYAKGHYVKGDLILDLKKIFGHRNRISPEYISTEDVWVVVVNALMKFLPPNKIHSYIEGLFRHDPSYEWGPDGKMEFFVTTRNLERAIRQAISMLRYLPVVKDGEEVMVLGEADPSILPVNPLVQKMKGE